MKFMQTREAIYASRRKRIAHSCDTLKKYKVYKPFHSPDDGRAKPLIHLPKLKLFYCLIPKVNF